MLLVQWGSKFTWSSHYCVCYSEAALPADYVLGRHYRSESSCLPGYGNQNGSQFQIFTQSALDFYSTSLTTSVHMRPPWPGLSNKLGRTRSKNLGLLQIFKQVYNVNVLSVSR